MTIELPFGPLDWAGLAAWLAAWVGYALWTERESARAGNLSALIRPYRRTWMQETLHRENRVTDAALVGNLMQTATFLASTTLIVIGGLFALLGTVDKSAQVLAQLPFAAKTSALLFETKTLVLTMVLAYAFLRFLWSIRQFNLLNILVGAYPPPPPRDVPAGADAHANAPHAADPQNADPHAADPHAADPHAADPHAARARLMVRQASRLNELAGSNFTQGLRAYYYAVPLLLWLVNPWLFLAGSVVITAAAWYMEYRSGSVAALALRD